MIKKQGSTFAQQLFKTSSEAGHDFPLMLALFTLTKATMDTIRADSSIEDQKLFLQAENYYSFLVRKLE